MRATLLIIGFIFSFTVFVTSAWPDVHQWLLSQSVSGFSQQGDYGRASVKFSETVVEATIPLTGAKQRQGLAGRTGLGSREGMLFIFSQPGRYPFWMKGMLIPLDFLWLNQGQVIDITANVPAPLPGQTDLPVYRPENASSSMLEVVAGFAAANDINIGDVVNVDRR